jgi:dipeptidase
VPIYAGNLSTADCYRTYNPGKYQQTSARWAIDFVDNLARLKFQAAVKDIWAARNPFEEEIFSRQEEIEKEALKRYKKNPRAAKEYLTRYSNGLMDRVVDIYLALRDTLMVKYTNNRE